MGRHVTVKLAQGASVCRVLTAFLHLAGSCVARGPETLASVTALRLCTWAPWDCRTVGTTPLPRLPRLDMGNAESTGDRSRDLYNAAKRGDVDAMRTLHAQGAGLEWRDSKVRSRPVFTLARLSASALLRVGGPDTAA